MNGYWCTPWASNPLTGSKQVCGRFNSYTLPPFLEITLMKYEESRDRIIAKEIFASVAGTAVTLLLFYFISFMMRSAQNSILTAFVSIISDLALIFVSSFMVYIVGKYQYQNGSYWSALSGSVIGFGVCFLTTYLISVFRVFG